MQYFANILGVGTPELLIILAVILLLFGSAKLPALFRSIGSSMRELRKGIEGGGEHGDSKTQQSAIPKKHQ